MTENTEDDVDIEFERIIINPMDYEEDVRRSLWRFLRSMKIHYEYEYY
jgi:hypothetical protein